MLAGLAAVVWCHDNPNRERSNMNLEIHNPELLPTTATGAVVLAALQSSPYRDIDLTPGRVLLGNVRNIVL